MRIPRLHEYPQLRCPFPHTNFPDDFRFLVERVTDEQLFNEFYNTHHVQYLRPFVEQVRPLLLSFIRGKAGSKDKYSCGQAIRRYLAQRREREEMAKAQELLREEAEREKAETETAGS